MKSLQHSMITVIFALFTASLTTACVTTALPTSFDQQLYAANQQIVTVNNLITNAVLRKLITPDKAEEIAAKVDKAAVDLDAIKAVKYTISGQEGLQRTQAILDLLLALEGKLQ